MSVTAEVESTSITSVFLDECLHMFFERFIPTFPVLHRATFVFRECTHPLLLNAIALGSLYMGPKDAVAKGEALWRLSHTAIATSWQTMIKHRGPHDSCKGIQLVMTALLGQVYASLSRNRGLRTTSQIFHALGFYWARHCGMFDIDTGTGSDIPAIDATPQEKEQIWHRWVAREIQRRILLAHYILDGQIAQVSGDPTSVRHAANQLLLPSSEAAFAAETAEEWVQIMHTSSTLTTTFKDVFRSLFPRTTLSTPALTQYSALSCRVILEGLQSLVSECDENDNAAIGVPTRGEIRRALAQFHTVITANQNIQNTAVETLEILLRWHAICLDAATDSTRLARHLCARYAMTQHIYGGGRGVASSTSLGTSSSSALDLAAWCSTPDARRCLLHAVAIQDIVEDLPRGRAHAIHMPTSLFAAATVYAVFALQGRGTVLLPRQVEWRDVLFEDMDAAVILEELAGQGACSGTKRFVRGDSQIPEGGGRCSARNLLYDLNSMQKLFRCLSSQWGIAIEMEAVVDQWIALCH
ncbi:hypothetical protein M8818_007736 [Zalaria obscura]|uniref:Uncharacterized protein n=1 Tax=Zalaria obscura TaxID=2024903 RepID=A0ACC3S2K0_9PEZI